MVSAGTATPTRQVAPNNFDALRLLAALMVILGHGQELKGAVPTILWNFPVSRIGLDIFFAISGYLVCESWLRSPHLPTFLLKRALRIVPALFVCVALTALVLGPLATALPLRRYLGHHETWGYFLNILLYLKLYLPGVFTGRPLGGAVNGSLWSLFPEVLCYCAIPLMWLAPRWGRLPFVLAVMAGCGLLGLWMFDHPDRQIGLVYSADPKYVLVQVPYFMAGAALRLVQTRLPQLFRLDLAVICTAAVIYLPALLGQHSVPYGWLPFAYVVISLGRCSTPVLNRAARFGDLSYGTYLYAFPLQQVVLDHGPAWGIVRCTLASLAMAFLSWHLVEAPALRLKPRAPYAPPAPGAAPAIAGLPIAGLPIAGLAGLPFAWTRLRGRPRRPSTPDTCLKVLFAGIMAASALLVAQSLYAILRFHDTVPFYDMILVDYQYLFGTAGDFWLFRDNEHRPLVAMPLYWLDLRMFHGWEGVLVVCNLVVAGCIAAVPFGAVVRAAKGRMWLAAACSALIVASGFWLANRENLGWPKQIHMYLSVLAMMLAFRDVARPRVAGVAAALRVSGWLCLSTFSFGFGFVGFPAVAIVAGLRRWSWRPLGVLAAAFAACAVVYGILTDGFSFLQASPTAAPRHLADTLLFALTFLAAPVVYVGRSFGAGAAPVLVGQCLAAAGLAVYAWRTSLCLARKPTELEAWAFLLAAFAVGNALQTALARASVFGVDYALQYRYIMGELPFWTGLLLLAVEPLAVARRPWQWAGAGAGLAVCAGLLVNQQTELDAQRWENAIHWQEAMSALTGVPDRKLYDERIWGDSDQVIRVLDGLRGGGMSIFSWPQAAWMGKPVSQFTQAGRTCMGEFRGSFPVAGGGGSLVLGWSGDRQVPDWASWIVLADGAGIVTGLARGGLKDGSAAFWTRSRYSAWRGYVRGSAASLTPYLILPGDRACLLRAPAGAA